ncbi:MAG: ferric reductase-like transmembrane domain-containing protein [Paracoccaceae bacterium]
MKLTGLAVLILTAVVIPGALFASLPQVRDSVALFSQYIGAVALILMAWAQVWATRAPGVESVFGGLDRVYVLHKWSGIAAMAAILLHDTIDAEMDALGRQTALNELGETLGELSLYGLLILAVISVATFIPYHLWKWTHKAMGAFFAAGAIHFLLIQKPFAVIDPLGLYIAAACVAGLLAYAVTLLPPRRRAYAVRDVRDTGGATAITLAPTGKTRFAARPGQFAVASFDAPGLSEPHPFTLSAPVAEDGSLQITAKALGDWTARLPRALAPGATAQVQGPFGRFTRRDGTRPEVWIAGGIGITPFLAWAEALGPEQTGPIHLFWAVRSEAEAPHLDRMRAAAAAHPALTLTLVASEQGQRLTAERIADTTDPAGARVAFCGPATLRRALQQGLARHGVTPRAFHYEEFEFRTGIGLRRLAAWIGARLADRTPPARQNG